MSSTYGAPTGLPDAAKHFPHRITSQTHSSPTPGQRLRKKKGELGGLEPHSGGCLWQGKEAVARAKTARRFRASRALKTTRLANITHGGGLARGDGFLSRDRPSLFAGNNSIWGRPQPGDDGDPQWICSATTRGNTIGAISDCPKKHSANPPAGILAVLVGQKGNDPFFLPGPARGLQRGANFPGGACGSLLRHRPIFRAGDAWLREHFGAAGPSANSFALQRHEIRGGDIHARDNSVAIGQRGGGASQGIGVPNPQSGPLPQRDFSSLSRRRGAGPSNLPDKNKRRRGCG